MFCLALLLCGAALVAAWPPSVAAQEDKKEKKADNPASETPPRVSQENLLTTSALFNTYRQIVIEGLVVEVDSTEARQWGIEMFYQRNPGNLGGGGNLSGAVLRTPNTFPLGGVPSLDTSVNPPEVNLDSQPIGAGATFDSFETDTFLFQTRVRAAVIGGKANILSQPIAVTQSGMEVNLSTVDEIPFQDIVVDAYQATIIPDYQKELGAVRADFKDFTAKKAGITLKVTPQLLPPERIQLDISTLDVGQLAGFIYVRGVARPIIDQRHQDHQGHICPPGDSGTQELAGSRPVVWQQYGPARAGRHPVHDHPAPPPPRAEPAGATGLPEQGFPAGPVTGVLAGSCVPLLSVQRLATARGGEQ